MARAQAHDRPVFLRQRASKAFALLAASALWLLTAACSNTEHVPLGVCGNHVVEQGEDCDGAARCSADCHYLCDAVTACPAGLGCDRTLGVCRGPSGTFTQTTLLQTSATVPSVADFDGDGREDLLLVSGSQYEQSSSTVYYFDPGAVAPYSVALPSAAGAAILDVNADTHADVVLGGNALYAYRSVRGRRFSPILGATRDVSEQSRLFSADLDCDGHREVLLWEGTQLYGLDASGATSLLLNLNFAFDQQSDISTVGVLGQPAAGARACEVLAIFEPAASHVHVYGKRPGAAEPELSALGDITLVDSPTVSSLLFLDVNADGKQDLMAQVQVAPEGIMTFGVLGQYVAFGLGNGSFDSHAELPTAGAADELAKRFDVPGAEGLLTTGQFDDDPALDYFSSASMLGGNTLHFYDQAIAVDLTADGRTDVAAVTLGAGQGFDLLRGTPSGLFGVLPVSTNNSPMLRDTGDFDGDAQPDLLLTEGPIAGVGQTTLSVLFSPVSATSARVQELSELHEIDDAAAGYLADPFGSTDGFADIAALHRDAAGALHIGLFQGGADRLLRSNLTSSKLAGAFADLPGYFPIAGQFQRDQPRALAVIVDSLFDARPGFIELFSLNADGAASLGLAPLDDELAGPRGLALDLDADGLDEIYALTNAGSLLELRLSGGGSAPLVLSTTTVALPDSGLALVSADVNADGQKDLSVQGANSVWVFLAGQPVASRLHTLPIPSDVCSEFAAHAWLQADRDAGRELVLNCKPFFDFSSADLQSPPPILDVFKADLASDRLHLIAAQSGPASNALAVGDFNGDGVEDLACSGGELSVLFGSPR